MALILHAVEAGSIAARILRSGATGNVVAAFDRSFYVDYAGRLLCLGADPFPSGPINVRIRPAREHPEIGMPVTIGLGGARTWRPPDPSVWTRETLRSGLGVIDVMAQRLAPVDGLSCLLFDGVHAAPNGPLHDRARQGIDIIGRWLRADGAGNVPIEQGVRALVGLGPGLTPSGDDFLVGFMVALAEVGKSDLLDALSAIVRKNTATRTSSISAAHLSAAAEGLGTEALHRTIQSILLRSDDLIDSVADLAEIGHSSGWDALAGAVLVLRHVAVT